MNTSGKHLRHLRKSRSILLRQVAAKLDIDTAVISKIESGNKILIESQVTLFANFYNVSSEELLTLRLCDVIFENLKNKPLSRCWKALDLAKEELKKR